MQYTEKLGLRLPEGTDNYDIADMNFNSETIEEVVGIMKNKVNRTSKYNKTTGLFNPATHNVEYTTSVELSDMEDGDILKIENLSSITVPESVEIKRNPVSLGSNYGNGPSVIAADDGNIIIIGCYTEEGYNYSHGYAIKINKETGATMWQADIGSYFYANSAIKLNNGNILICGNSVNSEYVYYAILGQNGTIVKTGTALGSSYSTHRRMLKLSNGKVILIGTYYRGSNYRHDCYLTRFDVDGTVLNNPHIISNQSSSFYGGDVYQLSNGKIVLTGRKDTNTASYMVLDSEATNVLIAQSSFQSFYDGYAPHVFELKNGNVAFIYRNNNISKTYIEIKDSTNFVTISNNELPAFFNLYTFGVEFEDTFVFVSGDSGTIRAMSIDRTTGNKIKTSEILCPIFAGSYTEALNTHITKISDSYAVLVVSDPSTNYTPYVIIIKNDGNIMEKKKISTSGAYYIWVRPIGTNEFAVTYSVTSYSNGGRYFICKFSPTDFKLNGINIDTILKQDSFYEMVYNLSSNLLNAEEVRN